MAGVCLWLAGLTSATVAAADSPTLTVSEAAAVIGVLPQHPTAALPFKPGGRGTADLRHMPENPGSCGSGTPDDVCKRWSAGIREARFIAAPQRGFRAAHSQIFDTAYVFQDEAGAKRVFPIIREIYTRGFFNLTPFPVRGLATQESGLIGALNLSLDDLGIVYLWRVANVVFEVDYIRAGQPESRDRKLETAFLLYAKDVNRRAQAQTDKVEKRS